MRILCVHEVERKGYMTGEILIFLAVVAGWFIVARWVLPKLGIPT